MPYNPEIHHRQTLRLQGYDYSRPGLYFITICTQHREVLFGDVVDGRMVLNAGGRIAQTCWLDIPNHFPHAILDEFVIMPNHVHGIIMITELNGNDGGGGETGAKNISPHQEQKQSSDNNISPHQGSSIPNTGAKDISPHQEQKQSSDNNISPHQEQKQSSDNNISTHQGFRSPSGTIGSMIRGFKIGVTKWFRQNTGIYTVWQRNYYENIVHSEKSLIRIRKYIIANPLKWQADRFLVPGIPKRTGAKG